MKYFSASTNGFYSEEIHGENMPDDVVEISDEKWQQLLEGQSAGKWITPDESGYPVLTDPPPPTAEEKTQANVAKKAQLMTQATTAIAPLQDAVDLDEATEEETALLKKWKQYRVTLNRIDANTADDIDWPEQPA